MVKGASRISAGKRIRLTSDDNQSDLYVTAYYSDDDLLVGAGCPSIYTCPTVIATLAVRPLRANS